MVIESLRAGAHSIISKDDRFQTLCKCIDVVQRGQVWINTEQMLYLIDYLAKTAPTPADLDASNVLTNREEGVVRLVGEA